MGWGQYKKRKHDCRLYLWGAEMHSVEKPRFQSQALWVQTAASPLTNYVILKMLHDFFMPQFPYQ